MAKSNSSYIGKSTVNACNLLFLRLLAVKLLYTKRKIIKGREESINTDTITGKYARHPHQTSINTTIYFSSQTPLQFHHIQ